MSVRLFCAQNEEEHDFFCSVSTSSFLLYPPCYVFPPRPFFCPSLPHTLITSLVSFVPAVWAEEPVWGRASLYIFFGTRWKEKLERCNFFPLSLSRLLKHLCIWRQLCCLLWSGSLLIYLLRCLTFFFVSCIEYVLSLPNMKFACTKINVLLLLLILTHLNCGKPTLKAFSVYYI